MNVHSYADNTLCKGRACKCLTMSLPKPFRKQLCKQDIIDILESRVYK